MTDGMLGIAQISARMEIYDALNRYARGADRRDPELLQSAYFQDAVDVRSYSPDELSPKQLADRVMAGLESVPEMSQHHLTNVHYDIDVDAGIADVESYALSFHPVRTSGPTAGGADAEVRFVGLRYVDRFERRSGEWRIARRAVIIDWARANLYGGPAPILSEWRADLRPGFRDDDPSAVSATRRGSLPRRARPARLSP